MPGPQLALTTVDARRTFVQTNPEVGNCELEQRMKRVESRAQLRTLVADSYAS